MDDGVEAGGAFALGGKAGHQENRQIGKIARRRQRQRDAVHHRHLDVGEQQIEGAFVAVEDFQRFGAIFSGDGVMAIHRDGARHQRPHRVFIVGNQYARHSSTVIGERDAHMLPLAISRLLKKRTSILRPSGGGDASRDLNQAFSPGFSTGCCNTAFQA